MINLIKIIVLYYNKESFSIEQKIFFCYWVLSYVVAWRHTICV